MKQVEATSQQTTGSSVASWVNWSNQMLIAINPVAFGLQKLLEYMRAVGSEDRGVKASLGSRLGPAFYGSGVTAPRAGGGSGRAGRSGGADNSAERLSARDLAAQTKIESTNLKTVLDQMTLAYKAMRDALGGDDSIASFTEQTNQATQKWSSNLLDALRVVEDLEKQALKIDATEHERALLQQQQDERRHKLKLEQDAEIKKNADAAWELRLKRAEIEREIDEKDYKRDKERQERFEKDAGFGQIPGLQPLRNGPVPKAGEDYEEEGPFDAWTRSWTTFFEKIEEQAPTLNAVFTDLGNIMQGAFLGLAQSIGSVVQQWVIYGNTGPAVMRKMLAAVLASVAAEAAVKAIMATAEGFYFLATGNYASAANAFTAAAFYGAVATVAAVSGRLVAGNSFNQQASRATGGSSASSGQGSHGNQGQADSSFGDDVTVREQGRNAPAGNISLTLKLDSGGVLEVVKNSIQTNGIMRGLIINTAEGA